jgi:hypothetical protein
MAFSIPSPHLCVSASKLFVTQTDVAGAGTSGQRLFLPSFPPSPGFGATRRILVSAVKIDGMRLFEAA